ncbi:MAG: DUF4838 domain-containing protein [Clostridia bacterium]|nr:DUF4838 domain-containing protein [Clostridia bacterium]
MIKPLALALAMLLLLTTLAGCTPAQPPEQTSPEQTTEATTPEETTPKEEVVISPTEKELTDVSIISGESETEQLAAAELKKHLEIKGVSIGDGGFPITLSIDPTLDDDAYRIEGSARLNPEENRAEFVNITGGNGRGVYYGVVRFLEEYAGTRFFTYELETHTADPVTLPQSISIEYEPVFEYRYTSWTAMSKDPLFCVKSGMNGNHGGITENMGGHISYASGLGVHTLGVLSETTYPYPGYAPNPCLSDPAVLATVIKNVRAALEKDPNVNIISVSQTDKEEYCTCDTCAAIDEEEGSHMGTLLRFVNAVAEDIAEDYPNVTVDTLAYKYTRKAPSITKPRENVCIRLCSIECHFNHPFTTETCTTCSAFCNDLVEWSKICENIYVWDYTTDFSYYLSFFPNLHVLRENMRFYAEHNVRGMFCQGNSQGPSGEFGELRAFLLAKLMMYPYMSEEEYYALMDEFLAAYYGGGWTYIRQYIDTLSEFALTGAGHTIYHAPFTAISEYIYRALEYGLNRYWNLAEKEAGDRLEYVQRSRLHWRYSQLMLNPDEEKALAFIDEVEGLGMAWREGKYHVNKEKSELFKRPAMWSYE